MKIANDRFNRKLRSGFGAMVSLLICLGLAPACKEEAVKPGSADQPENAVKPENASSQTNHIVDLDGLKQIVAAHEGKVIYMDFWATWCAPCVKAMPELTKHQEHYGKRGFQAIAVSFDDPAQWGTRVKKTLAKVGWEGPTVVVKDEENRKAIQAWLGKTWKGDLPARYIFDRKGVPVHELVGTSADEGPKVRKMIEGLLGS